MLEKTQTLLRRNTPAVAGSAAAAQATATAEVPPEPSKARQPEDPLETSLVESGPLLVNLNPFEEEDEPMIRPTAGA